MLDCQVLVGIFATFIVFLGKDSQVLRFHSVMIVECYAHQSCSHVLPNFMTNVIIVTQLQNLLNDFPCEGNFLQD